MNKLLEITGCEQCKFLILHCCSHPETEKGNADWRMISNSEIENGLPDWCPLPESK